MEDWEVQACLSVVQWRKHGEGRLAKALAFSVMAPSAWYGCAALHCLMLCTMHQRPLNVVLLSTCVLMLRCPAQENSNFRSCVSVERLFNGSFSLAVRKINQSISPLAVYSMFFCRKRGGRLKSCPDFTKYLLTELLVESKLLSLCAFVIKSFPRPGRPEIPYFFLGVSYAHPQSPCRSLHTPSLWCLCHF